MPKTLSDFISLLERHGELVRVSARVSPILEIAAIADRLSKCPAPHAPSAWARATDPRYCHLGGPAVLFENVEGSDIPVLINAFGSYRRMELALGRPFAQIADEIAGLVKPHPPRSLREALAKARELLPVLRVGPKRGRRAVHHDVVLEGESIDLTRLPLIRCWPRDGDLGSVGWPAGINAGIEGVESGQAWNERFRGRYITLGGIHTIHADDRDDPRPASHNIGMYRVQLLGPRTMAMHWHMHHDGANHWRSWKKLGKPMPVAIVLGGESVLAYSATCPLPPGISELLMAGFLNRGGIPLARARTVPLWVPASAEIVIEGYASWEAGHIGFEPGAGVDRFSEPVSGRGPEQLPKASGVSGEFGHAGSGLRPETGSENRPTSETGSENLCTPGPGAVIEGPFGDHTGFYSLPDRYPILTVTAITMRRKAVYPTTVVGLPPQEDYFLGKATERIMLPLLKTLIHDIEDYDLPMFGAFHNCALVRIRKQYPLQARRVMHAIWGAGQMSWTKCVFVVDQDVDVHDTMAVLRAAGEFCDPARDIETVRGPLDILDHAAPYLGAGTKIGFDCTRKREGEQRSGSLGVTSPHVPNADATAAFIGRVRQVESVLDARAFDEAPSWLFVRTDIDHGQTGGPGRGRRVLSMIHGLLPLDPSAGLPHFIIAVGRGVDLRAPDALNTALFHWCANFDAGRDAEFVGLFTDEGASGGVVLFDATPKSAWSGGEPGHSRALGRDVPVRPWPPVLEFDKATRELVARRWSEYGLSDYRPQI